MRSRWWPAIVVGFVLLLAGTVTVFMAFDHDSHSVSDTLRPFLITVVPVWVIAVAGAMAIVRRRSR